jgi:aspartate racemase
MSLAPEIGILFGKIGLPSGVVNSQFRRFLNRPVPPRLSGAGFLLTRADISCQYSADVRCLKNPASANDHAKLTSNEEALMKTIGLIGGMTWLSSLEYYRIINESVRERLGGLHSAKSVIYSFDFDEIARLHRSGGWVEATELMVAAARRVEASGAELVVICTNTMHKMADEVQAGIGIPLIHIVDVTAEAILSQGLRKVGVLGSIFTMEEDFYRGRLERKHGIETLVPDEADRRYVNSVINDELALGFTKPETQDRFRTIIGRLASSGAQGIILGCTEIPLLVKQKDYAVPLFDTTTLHARAAVAFALGPKG